MCHAQMCHAQMRNAQMCHAQMRHAQMCHAQMCHVQMRHAQMCHALMRNAQMRNAYLEHQIAEISQRRLQKRNIFLSSALHVIFLAFLALSFLLFFAGKMIFFEILCFLPREIFEKCSSGSTADHLIPVILPCFRFSLCCQSV